MPNSNPSPNMGLPIPVIGVDPSPQWPNDVNNSLTIIDGHTHVPGAGVPITPNGLNINSDLPLLGNNLVNARSVRFTPQISAPSNVADVGCLSVVGNELYYNDVSGGHKFAITNNGSVNAGAGSISGLPSGSASATFSAGTFVWQSATNTAANLDARSIVLRNSSPSSFGLTLNPPASMGSNIVETLPEVPGATSFMQMDSSGNMAASVAVNGITAANITNNTITATQIANNTVTAAQIANNTITATQIANTTITATQVAANTLTPAQMTTWGAASGTISSYTTTNTANSNTGLNANLGTLVSSTTGRPVFVTFPFGQISIITTTFGGAGSLYTATASIYVTNGITSNLVASQKFSVMDQGVNDQVGFALSSLNCVDFNGPSLGRLNYQLWVQTNDNHIQINVSGATMNAFQV